MQVKSFGYSRFYSIKTACLGLHGCLDAYAQSLLGVQILLAALPLSLLNFLNTLIHLLFLELSIINFWLSRWGIWSWSTNGIESGHTEWMCRLVCLFTGDKVRQTFFFNSHFSELFKLSNDCFLFPTICQVNSSN